MSSDPRSCAMYNCPHVGTALGGVVTHTPCSSGCNVPMCEGCCTDMATQTGALRCIGCRGYFASFTASAPKTLTQVLRKQHAAGKKRSRVAAEDVDDAAAGPQWVIDSIIGVHHFGGEVYYKVAYELDGHKNSTRWVDVEAQTQWELRAHLLEQGCQLLLSEFHDRFLVPMPVPVDYRWEFSAPSFRRDPRTKALQFRCAVAGCSKEFASKDAAHKHAYSMAHLAKNEEICLPHGVKSPFVCLFCPRVKACSQMSSLSAHRVKVHTVKNFDAAAWVAYGEQLREEVESDSTQ